MRGSQNRTVEYSTIKKTCYKPAEQDDVVDVFGSNIITKVLPQAFPLALRCDITFLVAGRGGYLKRTGEALGRLLDIVVRHGEFERLEFDVGKGFSLPDR